MRRISSLNLKKGMVAFLCFFVSIVLIYVSPTTIQNAELSDCYFHICIQLCFFSLLWGIVSLIRRTDIFEPIVLLTAIHILLFEITPLICIVTGRIGFFGEYVWDGCIKGTYLSTLGYCILLLFYFSNYRIKKKDKIEVGYSNITDEKQCLLINYCIWIFAFICSVVLISGYGLNIMYLITGGQVTLGDSTESKSIYGFLAMFTYMMIPSFLYVFAYGKSKIVKLVMFYLMFMSYYVRGFRFIMVAALVAPIIYHYLKKQKRPRLISMVCLLVALIVFSGFVQYARSDIRAGIGIGSNLHELISVDNIVETLVGNFEITKTYYAMVKFIPENLDYTFGREMIFYTIILFIPRAIWHGKPQPPVYDVVTQSLNNTARLSGTSFPYLAEYFMEFGPLGICFFMAILGTLLKKLKPYMLCNDIHSNILYASLFPLLLQILIRGYTPTNFYMVIFIIMPVILTKKLSSKRKL